MKLRIQLLLVVLASTSSVALSQQQYFVSGGGNYNISSKYLGINDPFGYYASVYTNVPVSNHFSISGGINFINQGGTIESSRIDINSIGAEYFV